MFGPPGHVYVYFIYGNHFCLNVSCLPAGRAGAILFRAAEPISGTEEMAKNRGISVATPKDLRNLTSGPGRLAEAFAITRVRDNDKDLTNPESDLYIAEDGLPKPRVITTIRIGITKAADRPLRYIVSGNPYVSGPKYLGNPK
jgi:DNA-3-methyladenine glycosylase